MVVFGCIFDSEMLMGLSGLLSGAILPRRLSGRLRLLLGSVSADSLLAAREGLLDGSKKLPLFVDTRGLDL